MMAAWLPTFYHDMQGVPIRRFAVFAMVGFVGDLCGTLTAGWMMDRLGARRLIPAIYLCLALAVCALGFVRFGTPLFLALIHRLELLPERWAGAAQYTAHADLPGPHAQHGYGMGRRHRPYGGGPCGASVWWPRTHWVRTFRR